MVVADASSFGDSAAWLAQAGYVVDAVLSHLSPLVILATTACVAYIVFRDAQLLRARCRMSGDSNVGLFDILSYRLDYWLSQSIWSKPFLLIMVVLVVVSLGGIIMAVLTGETLSAAMWKTWLLIVDTGAHGEFETYLDRLFGLLITICGMLVFGFLVGIVTDVIAEKVDQLKRGRSRVMESGHTLILNWSDKTLPVIAEICNANESLGGGVIVLLSEEPKEDLEQKVAEAEINLRGTKVIVRSGSPIMVSDLEKVSASRARAIVILAKEDGLTPDESDSITLRSVLCLKSMHLSGHVVCELRDLDNRDLIEIVGGEFAECVVAHDVIGRIMIQAALQPGIAVVLDKVLGFDGSEFYLKEWPELTGLTFEQAFFRFNEAILVGVRRATTGETLLNPSSDLIIEPGDKLIVIAEDDDSYAPIPDSTEAKLMTKSLETFFTRNARRFFTQNPELLKKHPTVASEPLSFLFIGWRRDMDDLLRELDGYVAKGTQVTLFAELSLDRRAQALNPDGLETGLVLKNIEIQHVVGSPLSRKDLGKLDMTSFSSVLILADETYEIDVQTMDSRSLTSLLLIRDINARHTRSAALQRVSESPSVNSEEEKDNSSTVTASPDLNPVPISRQRSIRPLLLHQKSQLHTLLDPEGSPKAKGTKVTCTQSKALAQSSSLANSGLTIISEILDSRTKALVSFGGSSDYVASNELVSKAIAMIAEEREISVLLQELLTSEGSELYVRPLHCLAQVGECVSFNDLAARAMIKNQILLGYIKDLSDDAWKPSRAQLQAYFEENPTSPSNFRRTLDEDSPADFFKLDIQLQDDHIYINPLNRSDPFVWGEQDCLILLSED